MTGNATLLWMLACSSLLALATAANAGAPDSSAADACARFEPTHATAAIRVESTEWRGDEAQDSHAASSTPKWCHLKGWIDNDIGFELWLPAPSAWNGRYLSAGVGGQAGSVNTVELRRAVGRGYAAASTDAGHRASDEHWLLKSPRNAANYAWRANHLLALHAKALVRDYYGKVAAHSYFIGCSGGGRQALTEVQKFPNDFDGVIAGAPGPKTPEMSARRLWEMLQHKDHPGLMSEQDWNLIRDSAVRECDADDGATDQLIARPMQCRFDIRSLACGATRTQRCLSAQQIAFAQLIYGPLRDERGHQIDAGLLPGVPVNATPLPEPFTPGPRYLATVLFSDGVHADPGWDARQFNIARDLPAIDHVMDLHADRADIRAFRDHGGKLILFQGWADPLVAAQPTVDYFQAVQKALGGGAIAAESVRLYMVPGMGHCLGGATTDQFGGIGRDAPIVDREHDLLTALEEWVEHGQAPQRMTATQLDHERVVRTRPLCPYPGAATYAGSGDMDDAGSFACE